MANFFNRVNSFFQNTPKDDASLSVPQNTGKGQHVAYPLCSYASGKLQWTSRETDEQGNPLHVRVPSEKTETCHYPGKFTAAGKTYHNWQQLCVSEDESGHFCKDIYGRSVLALWERFPCFDSYDYLYENRYYRWFFLQENGKLTRIFYTDERKEIHITEDVCNLESKCWEQMQKLGYWK